jgi:hypothetical protein
VVSGGTGIETWLSSVCLALPHPRWLSNQNKTKQTNKQKTLLLTFFFFFLAVGGIGDFFGGTGV